MEQQGNGVATELAGTRYGDLAANSRALHPAVWRCMWWCSWLYGMHAWMYVGLLCFTSCKAGHMWQQKWKQGTVKHQPAQFNVFGHRLQSNSHTVTCAHTHWTNALLPLTNSYNMEDDLVAHSTCSALQKAVLWKWYIMYTYLQICKTRPISSVTEGSLGLHQ